MNKETKPTSKVIHIEKISSTQDQILLTALCADGSIWQYDYKVWECILEPHEEPVDEELTKEKLKPLTPEERGAFENLKKWLSETDDGEDYKSLFYQIVDKAHDLVDAMEAREEKPEGEE